MVNVKQRIRLNVRNRLAIACGIANLPAARQSWIRDLHQRGPCVHLAGGCGLVSATPFHERRKP
jgi:hypothetical protein